MLYRDSENGMVMGVCAGLANGLDLNTRGVRIVAFLCLLFFTMPSILLYFVAGFLLRDRPLHFDSRRERQFWKSDRSRSYSKRHAYTRHTTRRS